MSTMPGGEIYPARLLRWIAQIHSSVSLDICSQRLNAKLDDFTSSYNKLPDYILEALDPILVYLNALTSVYACQPR